MEAFPPIYDFVDFVLRGGLLAAQSLSIGGAAFFAFILFPGRTELGEENSRFVTLCSRILFWSALILALGELLSAGMLVVMLVGALPTDVITAASADAVVSDLVAAAAACALAFWARGRAWRSRSRRIALAAALLVAVAHGGVTHAASRADLPALLVVVEIVHLLAVAIWIGGILYFILALRMIEGASLRHGIARRFSLASMLSVVALVSSGFLLAASYTGSPEALYQTNCGVLLGAKVALLLGLLCLGAANFLDVRSPAMSINRLASFAEVEVGIGLTALLCAAALASSPLSIDSRSERPSLTEISDRFGLRWPRFDSPAFSQLSAASAFARDSRASSNSNISANAPAPSKAPSMDDVVWSEVNHRYAGVLVALMGLCALLERYGRVSPVARHWPLLFLFLAAILVVRSDEEAWPLGRIGFFESLATPQTAQHKLFIGLIAAFGLFEWRARLKRRHANWPSYIFPLTTLAAAALLLTHYGHTGAKDEVLMQLSHVPVALLGVVAASARWLEIRLPGSLTSRVAGTLWPIAFVVSGALLVFYREV